MSTPPKASYAATLGSSSNKPQTQSTQPISSNDSATASKQNPQKPSLQTSAQQPAKGTTNHHPPISDEQHQGPDPSHLPKTNSTDEDVYVLTFLTDSKHHKEMTALRDKYFPPKLNRLEAHLTLFHALPGSKLIDTIVPTLETIAAETAVFHLLASTPFKLKRGIAIGVPKSAGGDAAREIHGRLKGEWESFLSDQDAGGFAAHYTIMNKVEDEGEVNAAFSEVSEGFKACPGQVEGLTLWRYVRSRWQHYQDFRFQR